MIEKRIKELINGAMDGELTDSEQAELDLALSQSEEARRYHAGMMNLDTFLQELPVQVPPDSLHDQITRSVQLRPMNKGFAGWLAGFVRYGLPAAAALLLAVVIFQFGSDTTPADIDQMIGTIAPGNVVELDSFSFQSDGLNSSVNLQRRNDTLVLNIELESVEAIDLNIDFVGAGLEYQRTLAKTEGDLEFSGDPGQGIHARSRGRQEFAVLLHRASDTASYRDEAIRLEYSSGGHLVQQRTLIPRW